MLAFDSRRDVVLLPNTPPVAPITLGPRRQLRSSPRRSPDRSGRGFSRTELSELPAVFRWTDPVADRKLDGDDRHELARLPPHRILAPPWNRRVLLADPRVRDVAVRRSDRG